jgi:rSAM/selenodomain-associated transferase 2
LTAAVGDADEVVVADGGSIDGSVRIAGELGARVVIGAAGRGPQMNRGARSCHSEILLFLHADSILPANGLERIRHLIREGKSGGGFLVEFDDPSPVFRIGSSLVNLRTRLTRVPLGDQGQFVTRSAFDDLGGFREWPILEDLDFGRRLKNYGEVGLVDDPVKTSARRYRRNGIARTIANNWWIWLLYFLGASPASLARRYRDVR